MDMEQQISFNDLQINPFFLEKLSDLHIHNPTTIQQRIIPLLQENKNILFQSETGTGKTFAYLLPLLDKISTSTPHVQLIILAPTYELASQIKSQIQLLTDIKTALFIGGVPIKRQIETLKEKPLIIVGGPARILELLFLKKLKVTHVKAIVVDETDRLLSPELRDDTTKLLEHLPRDVQVVGCSATITPQTEKIIKKSLTALSYSDTNTDADESQKTVQLETILLPPEDILQKKITHIAVFSEQRDKIDTLRKIIYAEREACTTEKKVFKAIVFTARPDSVDQIVAKLAYKKIDCVGLHAKVDKVKRKQALDNFRKDKISILVTSDLAARGLDIQDVSHVIQMDMPSNTDFFIHRAGRTGRNGKQGIDIVIGDQYEMKQYARLEKKLHLVVYPKVLFKGKLVAPNFQQTPEE